MHKKQKRLIAILVVIVLVSAVLLYLERFYHAEASAWAALKSDAAVSVVQTDYGWLFDGPSQDTALIFYPGAKVQTEAYAPLLRELAAGGMDVCLVSMPFRLALLGVNSADAVMRDAPYSNWFIGGHSLGGAMAARYAADHADRLTGVVLLAAYPTRPLKQDLVEISVSGTEDGVLNRDKVAAGRAYAPEKSYEYVIDGANHAQFGNYGEQKGDGTAQISAEEQQLQTAAFILSHTLS